MPLKRAGTWNAKFHPGLHEGMDVRTDNFLRTKISWMHRLLNFLTMLRFARERAPLSSHRLGERSKETRLTHWRTESWRYDS